MPCVSPNTCTSMWRGRSRYFSTSTRSSPKADFASRLRRFERCRESLALGDDAHALAAAAGGGLDQHRVADLVRLLLQERRILVLAVVAGHQRHAGLLHQALGGRFVAHRRDRFRRRSDENDAGLRAGGGEVLVLGEEAVARVDRFGAGVARGGEDRLRVQVARARLGRADAPRLVGKRDMARVAVGVRVHRHRAYAHVARGRDDTAGDLAAVGDEDLAEHVRSFSPRPACAFPGTKRSLPCLPAKPGSRRCAWRCRRSWRRPPAPAATVRTRSLILACAAWPPAHQVAEQRAERAVELVRLQTSESRPMRQASPASMTSPVRK